MGKLVTIMVMVVLSLLVIAGACARPAPAPASPAPKAVSTPAPAAKVAPAGLPKPGPDWPKRVSMGATSVGSGAYPLLVGWAEMMEKYAGIKASVEAAGGSTANINRFSRNEMEIGVVSPDEGYDAYRGRGNYAGKPVDIRIVGALHYMRATTFTPASSGIKSVYDFKGRRYAAMQVGSGLNQTYARLLVEAHGLTDKDVKLLDMTGPKDILTMMQQGVADAGQSWGYRSAAVVEAFTAMPMVVVPVAKEAQEYISKKIPFFAPTVVEKGAYKGVDADVPSMGARQWVGGPANLPDDWVYWAVKSVYDHLDEYSKYSKEAKEFKLENNLIGLPIPWHPGAIKYLKEKGVWNDKLEQTQAKLLSEGKR